jgi:heme/copper-type cytochrome/quinol oxidase subunit 2
VPLAARADDMAAYEITLTDGVVAPQVLEVPAGTEVTLNVSNTGTTPAEFESKNLHIEQVIAPGASATFTLKGLAAGVYKFVEEFHENEPTGRGVIEAK